MAEQGEAEFEGTVVRKATDDAIHVELVDGRTLWVPKSLICEDSEVRDEGDEGLLLIPEWFALRKDLL